jgi:hypothetical protein
MTKRPYTRRAKPATQPTKPFVVYVTFPSGPKEYCYLCNLPDIRQGSVVVANGTEVIVRRTAESDPLATKWVQSRSHFDIARRKHAIVQELIKLEEREEQMARFRRLKSPEAKRLLKELESL